MLVSPFRCVVLERGRLTASSLQYVKRSTLEPTEKRALDGPPPYWRTSFASVRFGCSTFWTGTSPWDSVARWLCQTTTLISHIREFDPSSPIQSLLIPLSLSLDIDDDALDEWNLRGIRSPPPPTANSSVGIIEWSARLERIHGEIIKRLYSNVKTKSATELMEIVQDLDSALNACESVVG